MGFRAINDPDVINDMSIYFGCDQDKISLKYGAVSAVGLRNESYFLLSRAAGVRGAGNQVSWHPAVKAFVSAMWRDERADLPGGKSNSRLAVEACLTSN